MVSFEKPKFTFNFSFKDQIGFLKGHKKHRKIPKKSSDKILICTWNIANLGLHKRTEDHYKIIAEILSWFDLIAIQEVYDDLEGLYILESFIGGSYELMFNDKGGNDERAAYFYDESKIDRLQLTGELAIPPSSQRHIKLPGVKNKFKGFDRNPFVGTFKFSGVSLMLLNAHLFFGGKTKSQMNRRALEAYAIGRYADLRRNDKHAFTKNIIALGDFNIPKAKKGDKIFEALTKRGLCVPEHSTKMPEFSTIASDSQYDQVAFFPGLKRKIISSGAFDYDKVVFPELWNQQPKSFNSYCKYYISDHRPMWVQMDCSSI